VNGNHEIGGVAVKLIEQHQIWMLMACCHAPWCLKLLEVIVTLVNLFIYWRNRLVLTLHYQWGLSAVERRWCMSQYVH